MKTLKRQLRRAFTIVELVIVIAVIAVLAAVLIPTFINVVNSANDSVDVQTVKNMNTTLETEELLEGEPPQYLCEVWDILTEAGYSYTPAYTENTFYWYKTANRIIIVQGTAVTYPTEYSEYTIVDDSGSSSTAAASTKSTAATVSAAEQGVIYTSEIYDMATDIDSESAHSYGADGICTICNHQPAAEKTVDQLAVDAMNAALAEEYPDGTPSTLCQVWTTLSHYGYNSSSYTAFSSGNTVYWYKTVNSIVIVSQSTGKVTYPSDYAGEGYYSIYSNLIELSTDSKAAEAHDFNEAGLCDNCGTSGGESAVNYSVTSADCFTIEVIDATEKTCAIVSYDSTNNTNNSVVYFPSEIEKDGTTYTVTRIGATTRLSYRGVFTGNTDLKTDVPALDYTVETVIIPESVTYIGYDSLSFCAALTTVNIPEGVTSIADAFEFCLSLKTINIPYTVKTIDSDGGAFLGCYSLESVTFETKIIDGKTYGLIILGNSTFNLCPNLKTIVFPETVNGINQYTFSSSTYEYSEGMSLDDFNIAIYNMLFGSNNYKYTFASTKIESVYYCGTAYNSGITVVDNGNGSTANIYYYSATQPEDTEHSYWHYVNGTPTPW